MQEKELFCLRNSKSGSVQLTTPLESTIDSIPSVTVPLFVTIMRYDTDSSLSAQPLSLSSIHVPDAAVSVNVVNGQIRWFLLKGVAKNSVQDRGCGSRVMYR